MCGQPRGKGRRHVSGPQAWRRLGKNPDRKGRGKSNSWRQSKRWIESVSCHRWVYDLGLIEKKLFQFKLIQSSNNRLTCGFRCKILQKPISRLNVSFILLILIISGDHCYKQNSEMSDKEQMITALPDVRCITLDEKDDFMVLACDGIWYALLYFCNDTFSNAQNFIHNFKIILFVLPQECHDQSRCSWFRVAENIPRCGKAVDNLWRGIATLRQNFDWRFLSSDIFLCLVWSYSLGIYCRCSSFV